MKSYTTVEWQRLLLWLVPPILRKTKHIQWLQALLQPLSSLYDRTLYQMQHTGQVMYLEKMLNEQFNPPTDAKGVYNPNYTEAQKQEHKLIYIAESLKPDLQHLYLHREYKQGYIAPLVYKKGEKSFSSGENLYLVGIKDYTAIKYANFRVMIPKGLNIEPQELPEDLIERQKLIRKQVNQLYFEDIPNDESTDLFPVDVKTPRFHELLAFYKLAGKTYETYKY